jgi:hypothetical protein
VAKKRIDYIFGTKRVMENCKSCGMLPFCYGYPSDHRAVFIRINLKNILSSEIHAAETIATRLIHSATPKERTKFLQELDDHYEAQNLYERLENLWKIDDKNWAKQDEVEFNKCDWQHIQGMLSAEKKTCKVKQHAWSPKYSKAVANKNFWKTLLTMKRNHVRPDQKTMIWANEIGISNILILSTSHINSKLREAQQQLRAVLKEAMELRETHLRELLQITQEANEDREHEKRLKILIRAHKKQYAYKKIQHILKPKQRSGLTHILVPEHSSPDNYPSDLENVTAWKMVHEHSELQQYLLL